VTSPGDESEDCNHRRGHVIKENVPE
jgi:hypothetical protein